MHAIRRSKKKEIKSNEKEKRNAEKKKNTLIRATIETGKAYYSRAYLKKNNM